MRACYTKRCGGCWWLFQCPTEQLHRVMCRACESIDKEKE
jgi:hypothetical protein